MSEPSAKEQAQQIVEKIKELVSDGNASRVYLKKDGETLLNVSVNVGIIGAVLGLTAAPFVAITTALVTFGLDCEIEIEKKDKTIVNLNQTEIGTKLENAKSAVKDMIYTDRKTTPPKENDINVEAEEKE
ncbi:MAG: DUF4342 domain-containing protein [Ruminococcaceae bacterium]|nr:DUF4342 domain-containing protein [Oscillospiraceae bacterium]